MEKTKGKANEVKDISETFKKTAQQNEVQYLAHSPV